MPKPLTNYATASQRIAKCNTPEDCDKMNGSLCRLFNAGCLTESEMTRLDYKLCDRRDAIKIAS